MNFLQVEMSTWTPTSCGLSLSLSLSLGTSVKVFVLGCSLLWVIIEKSLIAFTFRSSLLWSVVQNLKGSSIFYSRINLSDSFIWFIGFLVKYLVLLSKSHFRYIETIVEQSSEMVWDGKLSKDLKISAVRNNIF